MAAVASQEAPIGDVKPPDANAAEDEGVRGGELMPFDDGSLTADKATGRESLEEMLNCLCLYISGRVVCKAQSSAASLVINFAEPLIAAGAAVFGLNLLVLPLLTRLSLGTKCEEVPSLPEQSGVYAYSSHGETNLKQSMRLFTEGEMRTRFGLLDSAFLFNEITMTTDEVDEHMNTEGLDVTEEEATKIQKWRDKANSLLKNLQKRSALAFLGLPPDAGDTEINKMYKKMALELHPDKGGDPEKFQELQEMKERLNEIEKEENEGKDEDDPDDEEAKKAKEKEKQEEEEESRKLPPNERIQKLRMDVHDNAVRVWQRARTATNEIVGDKSIKANAQPALNIFRAFVERFVSTELKALRHDDVRGAEAKFRKFVKQGAEILAVAAMADVQATLTTLAMSFNFKLAARSGSKEIKELCDRLMEAIANVPVSVEAFLKELEDSLADQKERDRRRKEAKAEDQKSKEAADRKAKDAADQKAQDAADQKSKEAAQPSEKGKEAGQPKAKAPPADPFADFAWDDGQNQKNVATTAGAGAAATDALRKRDERENIAAAVNEQKRTCWDPDFDHGYAGALKSNGSGIFCRPCQRWITTYEFNTEAFLTHVERAHPKPPPGWKA